MGQSMGQSCAHLQINYQLALLAPPENPCLSAKAIGDNTPVEDSSEPTVQNDEETVDIKHHDELRPAKGDDTRDVQSETSTGLHDDHEFSISCPANSLDS